MPFLEFENLIVLGVGIINFLFGFAILLRGEKNRANTIFFALAVNLALWSWVLVFARTINGLENALLLTRILYAIAAFIPYFFIMFASQFLVPRKIPLFVPQILVPTLLAAALSLFTDGIVTGVILKENQNVPVFGSWYIVFVIYILLYFAIGLWVLFRRIRKFPPGSIESLQLKFVFSGAAIPIIATIITNVILLSVFSNASWRSAGPASTAVMTALFSYAIFKHHLFNLKVIATEFFSSFLVLIILFQTIFAKNIYDFAFKGIMLGVMIVFGILLIRSVLKEVHNRERISLLTVELQEKNEELRKLDAAKSEFMVIASRELNQPLAIIKNEIKSILDKAQSFNIKGKEVLDRVAFSANQLVKLVNSLLDLSQIESGKIKYELRQGDLGGIVEGVAAEFRAQAEKRGLILSFEKIGEIPPFYFDADKIREVVVNLIDNAIKYTSQGSVQVNLKRITKNDIDMAELRVKDNGVGINADVKNLLFTKFTRSDEARKIDPNGMGLGLYFVKRVVEDHGGHVDVESEGIGNGSTFIVELPIRQ